MAIWTAEIEDLEKLYGSIKDQLPDIVKSQSMCRQHFFM